MLFRGALHRKRLSPFWACDIRYRKRPPMVQNMHAVRKTGSCVRDAFSEAFGVKNRLLWYGRDIRCKKQAPEVRDFCDQISKEKAIFVAGNFDPKDVSTRDNFFDK